MTPQFPCRNLIFHTYHEFFEKEFAFEFSASLEQAETPFLDHDSVTPKVEYYDSLFQLFEDEINQNIFAGNSTVIISLFQDLKLRRQSLYPIPESIVKQIEKWNNESYEHYQSKIIEKAQAYFSNQKFEGLKHLDSYEDYVPENMFDPSRFKKVIRTYHDFYCVEDKWPDYFNIAFFDLYMNFLSDQADKMASLLDKYIKRYDAGEFTKSDVEKTYYEKTLKKGKNNKLLVWIFIGISVIGLIGTFKKNIMELFSPVVVIKDSVLKS
ncbi:MAG TPA: hypothetical protein VNZ49_05955 [Bacteroidia bacterium]|jgi:hypothetical protein|nr:hypothetical protein [Bacteroidia bacterium]